MARYVWWRLRRGLGRTVALLLAIVAATASFVVLTGAARTTQLRTVGAVSHNYRSAYDILVRPKGSETALERSRGLVRPNYLSGIFGGISLRQYHIIESLPGVQVAAPIAMIGYIVPRVAVLYPVPAGLGGAARTLYRVDKTWVFDRGLSHARDASGFVYLTKSQVIYPTEIGPTGLITRERAGRRRIPVCRQPGTQQAASPFAISARTDVWCLSTTTGFSGQPGSLTYWSFPLLIAAIDPTAEARLVGLNRAVVSGRYLRPADSMTTGIRGGSPGFSIPVLVPSKPYVDEQLQLSAWRLPAAAARSVLRSPLSYATAQRRFGSEPGTLVGRSEITADQAYHQLLPQIESTGAANNSLIDSVWTPGPVRYRTLRDGVLQPQVVTNPTSIWANAFYQNGYVPAPLAAADVQFRKLTAHPFTSGEGQPAAPLLRTVGQFNPAKLAGFSGLSALPLETYAPPQAAPGDAAAARALGGRDLLPDGNMGGYLQQPPMLLTTLSALAALRQAFPNVVSARPVSAIRVRVAGVHGLGALSRARVNQVATTIAARTGLDVSITIGSSPAPQRVLLAAGRFGRPALLLREAWSKEGVAVAILDAVDRTSVLLFTLILAVCALFVGNAAAAAVRTRRAELGVLACLGWGGSKLFAAVLTEVGLIGLVAGLTGAALALPLSAAFGLAASPAEAVLAVVAATVLTLLAGIVPAWRASRSDPSAALRAPVLPVRTRRSPRGVGGLAVINLLRSPGRSVLGALALAIGICALTLLLAFTLAFRGQVVGTLLGNAVAVQTRPVDYVAAVVTVLVGVFAAADVVYLNTRERLLELAILRAIGWRGSTLSRLITIEGAWLGLAGSAVGAITGLAGAAVFTGTLSAGLLIAALAAAAAGTALVTLAAVAPASVLGRRAGGRVLAEEE